MRVIAGKFRGRRLRAPVGVRTRPTSDRVREALFSILGIRVQGAEVLDLFAGSGALGIEALSRGAQSVTFVDRSAGAIKALSTNLEVLGLDSDVHRVEAVSFLRKASIQQREYDLVFVDPPYSMAARLGRELSENLPPVLMPGALVVCESDRRTPLDLQIPLEDERRYGDTLIRIHVFQQQQSANEGDV